MALPSFNGDISKWDVSKVTNMEGMFYGARTFNGDISKWDTSKVTDMAYMFFGARTFNGDISRWNLCTVRSSDKMFHMTALSEDHKAHPGECEL